MSSFRVAKPSSTRRRQLLIAILESEPKNLLPGMARCSQCVQHDAVCYHDSARATKCSECIRRGRKCDGTFSLVELKKIGDLQREAQKKSRLKRQQIAKLSSALLEQQSALAKLQSEGLKLQSEDARLRHEDVELQNQISLLDATRDRILKREMEALGVLREEAKDSEELVFSIDDNLDTTGFPLIESVDWSEIWDPSGDILVSAPE